MLLQSSSDPMDVFHRDKIHQTDDLVIPVRFLPVIGRVQVQQVQVKYWIIKKCTLYFT